LWTGRRQIELRRWGGAAETARLSRLRRAARPGFSLVPARIVTGSSMSIEIIAELDDSRLEPFRNLKATNRTRWTNQFIA
jgi:hypothetical protein